MFRDVCFGGAGLAIGIVSLSSMAAAIEPAADEKARLKACEAKICATAIAPGKASGPLACSLSKTWQKSTIEDGVRTKKISWTFGDARCDVDVELSNDDLAKAFTQPAHSVKIKPHTVSCKIERENEVTDVSLSLAPEIKFEGGKAKTALLNVSEIKAPALISGAIWTVAKIEDNIGLFHSEMISEINEFLFEKCPKRHGG